jgi:AcrR family transcriptional regulator
MNANQYNEQRSFLLKRHGKSMTSVTRKERKREQQRQEILLAARELFLREGTANFTMRKLAKEVGCVPGTLYLYFEHKDDLIAILVEESFEHLMNDLERPRSDLNPLEFLKEMMYAYIEFGLVNPNHYRFAFMLHRTKSLEKARPRPHRSFALLLNTVKACVDQQLIRQVDAGLAAQGVWAGIHGVTSLMITIPNFPWGDKATVIDHVVSSLVEGLKPSAKASPEAEGDSDDN